MKPISEFYLVRQRGKRRPYTYCRDCARAKTRAYRLSNPGYDRQWVAAHRDEHLAKRRARRAAKPEVALRESLRQLHRLSLEEYRVMAAAQSERCAICREVPAIGRLQVDHDHQTGRIRGLLCGNCNKAMGLFGDDPMRLRAALGYLGIIALAEAIGL